MADILIALTGISDKAQEEQMRAELVRIATAVKGVLPNPKFKTLYPPVDVIQGPGEMNCLLGSVPVLCLEIDPSMTTTKVDQMRIKLTIAFRDLMRAKIAGMVYRHQKESTGVQAPLSPQAEAVPA